MIIAWVYGILTPTIAFPNFRISRIKSETDLLGKNILHILQIEQGDSVKTIGSAIGRIRARFKRWDPTLHFVDPAWLDEIAKAPQEDRDYLTSIMADVDISTVIKIREGSNGSHV